MGLIIALLVQRLLVQQLVLVVNVGIAPGGEDWGGVGGTLRRRPIETITMLLQLSLRLRLPQHQLLLLVLLPLQLLLLLVRVAPVFLQKCGL